MGWEEIASLIIQYGLPFAESLFTKLTAGTNPTAADFTELRTLAQTNAKAIMTAQLQAAGIALTDPKAIALLAQVT